MSEFKVKATAPLPSVVRAWGAEQNSKGATYKGTEPGTRGRLNPALVSAYNKAHKGANRYVEGKAVKSIVVSAKPEKGRKVTARISVTEARKAAVEKGLPVGARGNLSQATIDALLLG
jgi:hypothetical protein